MLNAASATILTVTGVVASGASLDWNRFTVPYGIGYSGNGIPYLPCQISAFYSQLDDGRNWTCVLKNALLVWQLNPSGTPLGPGVVAGIGSPNTVPLEGIVPTIYIRTDVQQQYILVGPAGSSSTTWQVVGGIILTTTGSSGPATLSGNTLNIPQYSGGGSMTWPSSPGYALYSGSSSWSTTHITDSGTAITASEPFTVTPASGDAGILGLASNTTNPALWTGEFNLLGAPSATVTAFAWQVPATTNVSAGLLHVGAEASNISQLSVSLVGIADLSATGTPSSTTFLRGDNTWATPAGAGTVTSVAMTVPSWLTVAGSPVTSSGTLAVTATTGETANEFLATPNGSSGALALRTIVGADFGSLTGCGTSGYVFTPADNDCIAASGTSAFSSLTSGTNTAAAMVVGSGASLAPTGTGTIQATNIASTISAGTNVTITGSGTTGSPYSHLSERLRRLWPDRQTHQRNHRHTDQQPEQHFYPLHLFILRGRDAQRSIRTWSGMEHGNSTGRHRRGDDYSSIGNLEWCRWFGAGAGKNVPDLDRQRRHRFRFGLR